MKTREITLYKEKSFIAQLFGDAFKILLGVAIAYALAQHNWSPKALADSVEAKVMSYVTTTGNSLEKSVDLTRDLVASEVMSETTKKAIYMLATGVDNDKKEIAELKEQLVTVQTQNVQMQVALDNALIPEATVKAAAVNHVVEPVKDGFITIKVKASDLWNTYEFQPEKVKGWISNVF